MEEYPIQNGSKESVEKQAGESKAPRWRLCSSHRPAEPGGRARKCGLLGELQGIVR